mmetsp:Transcript_21149/g.60663  ORF Transcript_21149/g.60663 Transcript_21149/m.60663 type:complete len:275 (+) Transcript_21149:2000-2824(+)
MVNNTDGVLDLVGHLHSILDGLLEVQIDDVIAIVGDGDLIAVVDVGGGAAHSEDGLAALARGEGGDGAHGVLVAEGGDLHGDGEAGAKAVGQLRLVNNNNELVGADLDHLLAEEGAAAALDKVEVGVDLVGTVDGDVELGMGVEGDEGDVEALGLLLGPDGGGDADDVLELARLEQFADPLNGEVGSTASTQADDHAGLDIIVDGLVAHHLLELVLGKLFGHVESCGGGGGVVASDGGTDGGGEGRSGRGEGSKAGGRGDAHLGGIWWMGNGED